MHDLQTIIHRNNERVDQHREEKRIEGLLSELARQVEAGRKIIPAIPPSQNSPEGTP